MVIHIFLLRHNFFFLSFSFTRKRFGSFLVYFGNNFDFTESNRNIYVVCVCVFVSMCSLWFLFVWRGKIANIIMLDANACGKSLHGIFCHSATYERLKRQSRNYDGCCLNIYIKIHTIQTPIVVWLCFTFDFSFTLSLYYLGRWSLCSADIGRIIGLVGACVFVFIECLFRITISDEKKKK